MNKSTATRISNIANNMTGKESFGFKRYASLPNKIAVNLKLSHHLSGNPTSTFIPTVSNFFGSMSNDEFVTWIISNS